MPNAASLSARSHGNPVEIVGALGQRVGAKADIASYSTVIVTVDQKDITAGLPLILVCVPEFLDAAQLCGVEGVDHGRYLQDGLTVGV